MDYWEEEYRIYRNCGISGIFIKASFAKKSIDYNERNPKKVRCGCGGHSDKCVEMKNKGIHLINNSGWFRNQEAYDKWYNRYIKPRKKIKKFLSRRKAMKLGRSSQIF